MSEETEPPVREFADRGTLWLLDMPQNLRGLLKLTAAHLVDKLDFHQAERQNRSFIPDDLQKQEADLLYKIPFQHRRGFVWIYVLLEHQSKPDRTMAYRLLSYMVQVWEGQVNAAQAAKQPIQLYPILPMVFYTGKRKWKQLPTLAGLMDLPSDLEGFVPRWETLFVNLHATPPATLLELGEAVTLVLRALKAAEEPQESLASALREVALGLDALPESVVGEIKKGLHYLYLLVKHKRSEEEQEALFNVLDEVIERRAEELREVEMTGAEALIRRGRREGREEGREEGRAEGREKGREEGSDAGQRALLLKQLTVKFGPLSEEIVAQVQALSAAQRERLAERLLTVDSLADLELSATAG